MCAQMNSVTSTIDNITITQMNGVTCTVADIMSSRYRDEWHY